jgi:hypothetical protein
VEITVAPATGPASGGTEVTIEAKTFEGSAFQGTTNVYFGPNPAKHVRVMNSGVIRAISPPGSGTVEVYVQGNGQPPYCLNNKSLSRPFTYISPNTESATYSNWTVSGSLTPKRLNQPIQLPSGATFNGKGELNTETGSGSVSGNLVIPAFTAPLKLFGVLPVELGMKLTPEGSIAGTVAKSETVSGDETLSVPVTLGMGGTSVSLLGLKIPTTCATTESLLLSLVDNLTREELLTKGWSFSGNTTIPKIKCEGGLLGGLFGTVLSALLSGPENAYSLTIKAPGG